MRGQSIRRASLPSIVRKLHRRWQCDLRGPDVVVIDASGAEQLLPFPEAFDDPIVSIESGELHLVMLLASGTVVTFGGDSSGQLGQPKVARRVPITQRSPGVVSWPDPHTSKSAVAIRAGRLYSGALLDDGTLVLWGQNTNGQCGIAPEETPMDAAPLELSALQVLHAALEPCTCTLDCR